ncbi:triose-phosphate transporter family-domain-containing protein [Lentinula edodes]|nr:triose-phosphate transporter family-domain-containing protein [Lentinula edodes]
MSSSPSPQHEKDAQLAQVEDAATSDLSSQHHQKQVREDMEIEDGEEVSMLPSPAVAQAPRQKPKITATFIIPIWIVLSSSVIIYNNYLYNTLHFRYPVFVVTWHLTFAAIGTRILHRTTSLLDGVKDVSMSKDMFLKSILPIGILFSGSLILSNTAYLYLSVSYIQMLKAFNAVAVLLVSWAFRISEPNRKLALIVLMISSGVAVASGGELKFNMFGFIVQAAAVGFEAARLVMIEILLHGLKMDPLVSLHYYAPVCAIINLIALPFTEGLAPFFELAKIGPFILFTNAAVAFLLNVAAVFLVGAGSGLVLTLTGVFKDILLITGSTLIFGSTVTPIQIFGYSVALGGLMMFKLSGNKK